MCVRASVQVRLQVQRQLAQALFKLSVEFRKEETRFLNKMEQQKGLAAGSSIGLIEDEGHGLAASDPGFTESQIQKVRALRQAPCWPVAGRSVQPLCAAGLNALLVEVTLLEPAGPNEQPSVTVAAAAAVVVVCKVYAAVCLHGS